MAVKPFANVPSTDQRRAAFYARKPIGIAKKEATPGSKTQKRKANKATHMTTTKAM
jgi:hypothetical protein